MKKQIVLLVSLIALIGCSGSPDRYVARENRAERIFVGNDAAFVKGASFRVRHVRIRKVGNKESFSEREVIQMYDALHRKIKTSVAPAALQTCTVGGQTGHGRRGSDVFYLDVYMQAEIFSKGKLNRQRALTLAMWPFSEAIIDREYLRVDLRLFDEGGALVAGYDMGAKGAQSWSNLLGLDAATGAVKQAVNSLCQAVQKHSH